MQHAPDHLPGEPIPPPRSDDQLLGEFLAARHEACPLCGYSLHGLRSDRCPECGSQLRLRVGLTEPRMAAYVTTTVSWAVGFGATGLLNTIATAQAPSNWVRDAWAIISLTLMVVSLAGLGLARRFRLLPPAAQKGISIASVATVTLALAAIVITFD